MKSGRDLSEQSPNDNDNHPERRPTSPQLSLRHGVAEIRDIVGELFDALKTLDIERATYKNKCAQLEGKKHGD